jgi:hypothetical protein
MGANCENTKHQTGLVCIFEVFNYTNYYTVAVFLSSLLI